MNVVDNMLHTDERNITNTISTLILMLVNEYKMNAFVNNAYLPGTYMYQKKLIFLSNFLIENVSLSLYMDFDLARGVICVVSIWHYYCYHTIVDIYRFWAVNTNDYFYSNTLFKFNVVGHDTLWNSRLVFNKNGIDRMSSKTIFWHIQPSNDICVFDINSMYI